MKKQYTAHLMNAEPVAGSSISDILSLAHYYVDQEDHNAARILFDRASSSCWGMIE